MCVGKLYMHKSSVLFFRQINVFCVKIFFVLGYQYVVQFGTYFLLQDIFIIIIGCFLFRVMVVDYNKSSKSINAGMVVVDVEEEFGIVVVEMELAS